MDHTKSRNIQELESVLHAAAGDLSLAHVAVLVEHPEAVRSALAVVADVLSSGRVSTFLGAGSDIETIGDGEPQRVNPSLTQEWGILANWGVGSVLRY